MKSLGLGGGNGSELGHRVALAAPTRAKTIVDAHETIASLAAFEKHQRGAVTHCDSRIRTLGCQPGRQRYERRFDLPAVFQRLHYERRGQLLERAASRIDAEHAEWCEQFREGTRVRVSDGGRGHVMAPQPFHRLLRGAIARQVRLQLLQERDNAGAEWLPVHGGHGGIAGPRRQRRMTDAAIGRRPRRAIGLRRIVIISGEPEHRQHRALPLRLQVPGERHHRECLVDRVERAGEEAWLLTRGHHDGIGREEGCASIGHAGRHDDRLEQARIHTASPGDGCWNNRAERRRDEAGVHLTCPTSRTRGHRSESGAPA